MPYRFRRKISDSVAEVTTPDGHTIRLPYTGSIPERGSIVQPQKDNCCCPSGLQFGSSPNRAIRTDPSPRRVSTRKPLPPMSLPNRLVYTPYLLIPYVKNRPIYTSVSYDDGFYLPFTNKFPMVGVTNDPVKNPVKYDKVGVIPPILFCFFMGSFDQWRYLNPLPEANIAIVKKIYVVDALADIKDYKRDDYITYVYSALQQFHPGCTLYTYRETDNRILPNGRLKSMFDVWWRNPLAFDYKQWPNY